MADTPKITHLEVIIRHHLDDGTVIEGGWNLAPGATISESRDVEPLYHPGDMEPYELGVVPGSHTMTVSGVVLPRAG